MKFTNTPVRRRLFNFLSLPAGLLIVGCVAALILFLLPETERGTDQWFSTSDITAFYVSVIALGVGALLVLAWHLWMIAELVGSRKQRREFAWNLAALLYPYLIVLLVLLPGIIYKQRTLQTQHRVTVDVTAEQISLPGKGDPIQIIYPLADSIYILTGKACNDSICVRIFPYHALTREEAQPLPELTLGLHTLQAHAFYHDRFYALDDVLTMLSPDTGSRKDRPESQATSGARSFMQPATPVCYAFHYTPGKKGYQLINYCGDTTRTLATLEGYTPASLLRYIKHYGIPVNYATPDGTSYTVVFPEFGQGSQSSSLAFVAECKNGSIRVYRVHIPGPQPGAPLINCFIQDRYCYLYDRWNGSLGQKDSCLYRFRLSR